MKKILLAAFSMLIGLQSFSNSSLPVNEKLLATFRETFRDAERVIWSEFTNGYTVNFVEHGILTRITYDKNGEFTGSLRNYPERNLPYYIQTLMHEDFPGEKIFGVTEITVPTAIYYFIKLEGEKFWKTVSVDNEGAISVVEKYRKIS